MISLTLMFSVPFWIMVENPLAQVVNLLLSSPKLEKKIDINMNETVKNGETVKK